MNSRTEQSMSDKLMERRKKPLKSRSARSARSTIQEGRNASAWSLVPDAYTKESRESFGVLPRAQCVSRDASLASGELGDGETSLEMAKSFERRHILIRPLPLNARFSTIADRKVSLAMDTSLLEPVTKTPLVTNAHLASDQDGKYKKPKCLTSAQTLATWENQSESSARILENSNISKFSSRDGNIAQAVLKKTKRARKGAFREDKNVDNFATRERKNLRKITNLPSSDSKVATKFRHEKRVTSASKVSPHKLSEVSMTADENQNKASMQKIRRPRHTKRLIKEKASLDSAKQKSPKYGSSPRCRYVSSRTFPNWDQRDKGCETVEAGWAKDISFETVTNIKPATEMKPMVLKKRLKSSPDVGSAKPSSRFSKVAGVISSPEIRGNGSTLKWVGRKTKHPTTHSANKHSKRKPSIPSIHSCDPNSSMVESGRSPSRRHTSSPLLKGASAGSTSSTAVDGLPSLARMAMKRRVQGLRPFRRERKSSDASSGRRWNVGRVRSLEPSHASPRHTSRHTSRHTLRSTPRGTPRHTRNTTTNVNRNAGDDDRRRFRTDESRW